MSLDLEGMMPGDIVKKVRLGAYRSIFPHIMKTSYILGNRAIKHEDLIC